MQFFTRKRILILGFCVVFSLAAHAGFLIFIQKRAALIRKHEKTISLAIQNSSPRLPFKEIEIIKDKQEQRLPSNVEMALSKETLTLEDNFSPYLEFSIIRDIKLLPQPQNEKQLPLPIIAERKPAFKPFPVKALRPSFQRIIIPTKELFLTISEPKKREPFPIVLLPSLKELSTLSCGKDFLTHVSYLSQDDGYLFAITIVPPKKEAFKGMKKNVFFLLDHSNAMQKRRLTFTKNAISSAIFQLGKNDTYNILAYNKTITALSAKNLSPSKPNLLATKNFLRSIEIGSFLTSANLSLALQKISAIPASKNEVNIVILLSSGENLEKYKSFFHSWTRNNSSFSLFAISMTDDPNNEFLDFFASMNGGQLIMAGSFPNIRNKLTKLIHSINRPFAQNISIRASNTKPGSHMQIYAPLNEVLYLDHPLVLLGSTKKLEDFTLFVQGRAGNKWVNIKKEISFEAAEEASDYIRREWDILNAHKSFSKYLSDQNTSHLQEASDLLKIWDMDRVLR